MVPAFNIHVKAFLFVKALFQESLYRFEMLNLDSRSFGFDRLFQSFQE